MCVVCCLLVGVCCVLIAVCCVFYDACCVLFCDWCKLHVAYCSLAVGCRLQSVVYVLQFAAWCVVCVVVGCCVLVVV